MKVQIFSGENKNPKFDKESAATGCRRGFCRRRVLKREISWLPKGVLSSEGGILKDKIVGFCRRRTVLKTDIGWLFVVGGFLKEKLVYDAVVSPNRRFIN